MTGKIRSGRVSVLVAAVVLGCAVGAPAGEQFTNRPPRLGVPDSIHVFMGDSTRFTVTANDPNGDPVTVTVLRLPPGASFTGNNPWLFRWWTAARDTGRYWVVFWAKDPHGGGDVESVLVAVQTATLFWLQVLTASGYNDGDVVVPVVLGNQDSVGGMDLLINYDISALTLSSVTRTGSRLADWELFSVVPNAGGNAGDIRIVGIANTNAPGVTPPLAPGIGPVAFLSFHITRDVNLAGFAIPVTFAFRAPSDNVLSDPRGNLIAQSAITFQDGAVLILTPGTPLVGDINLNGAAFDIGDAIRLINFFLNPGAFPLNAQQRVNSDINGDGIPATVGDLVALIRRILEGGGGQTGGFAKNAVAAAAQVTVQPLVRNDSLILSLAAPVPVSGLFLEFGNVPATVGQPELRLADPDFTLASQNVGSALRLVLYSSQGRRLPAGCTEVLSIPLRGARAPEISQAACCDSSGDLLETAVGRAVTSVTPVDFFENYPNPFNPATTIAFRLPQGGRVNLSIFNILGQKVKTLVDGTLSTGRHELKWDGTSDSGQPVASGVYFSRLITEQSEAIGKMTLLR